MLRSSFIVCILTVAMAGSAWGQDAQTPDANSGCDTAACDSACDSGCDSACDNKVGGSLFGAAKKMSLTKPRILQACDTNACDSDACDSNGCDSRVGSGGLLKNRCRFDLRVTRCGCVLPKYTSIFAGWTATGGFNEEFHRDTNTLPGGQNGRDDLNLSFNDGWPINGVVGFANGRYINDKWRIESEWAYRRAQATNSDALGAPVVTSLFDPDKKANLNVYSWTANLYRDFGNSRLRPYMGVGGGFNLQQMQGQYSTLSQGPTEGRLTEFGVKTWGLGYQGIIGLSYQTKRCNNVFLEYRYYGTSDTNLRKISRTATQVGTPVAEVGQNTGFNIDQNSIVFGLRINR